MIEGELAARDYVVGLEQSDALAMTRLDRLAELLATENQRQNLVSVASLDEMWLRHIADSAQLLAYVPRETGSWLDLGTGAGFPGLVIACLLSGTRVLLVESRARRIAWLREASEALGLGNVTVLGQRLELVKSLPVSVISARAFAPLDKLLRLSARFSTADTLWLLPKGRSARQELHELTGWDHSFHVEQSLTDSQAGIIVGALAETGRIRSAN